jgi:hypothetical protein
MGVDLTLVPERLCVGNQFLAYDRLGFAGRYYDFWEKIQALDARQLPHDCAFRWYGDEGIEEHREDAYGEPLRFVTSGDLVGLELPDNLLPWDRGIFAFLKALPPSTRVVLWWH